jgi:hypothetical protein
MIAWSGFEVLNQSSSLTIPSGQAFIGNKKESLALATTSAYNAGIVGTKGARVSKYLLNGAISQVVRECAATPSYYPNANHADEEVVRRINWREFGANRGDDFSTLSTVRAAAFTLDDGTTTLVGSGVIQTGSDMFVQNAAGDFYTITFVGTGLDLIILSSTTVGGAVYIDGVLISGTINTAWAINKNSIKICSGLPYGTHTVKFVRDAIAFMAISDFIIYQPKAPTLPVGAIQIADYNVMADFVFNNTTASAQRVSSGVLRKQNAREMTCVGASWLVAGIDPGFTSGININTGTTAGAYLEYTFYGTGFDLRTTQTSSCSNNISVSINGVAATTANYPSMVAGVYNGGIGTMPTFSTSTGVLGTQSATTSYSSSLAISGLPLARYTVRLTQNTALVVFIIDAFDIITPIHINHPTLKIGSLSLLDNKMIQALALPVSGPDLSKAKAWVLFNSGTSKIEASHNVSQILSTSTGCNIYFSKPFKSRAYIASGSSGGSPLGNFLLDSAASTPNHGVFQQYNSASALVAVAGYVTVVFFGELAED